jgi:hypothetical protein
MLTLLCIIIAAPGSMSRRGRSQGGGSDDDEDEDPMARFGPMPEAGAFAAGPIEDEGEDIQGGGDAAGPSTSAPNTAHEAAAYYVGGGDAAPRQQYYYDQHGQYAGYGGNEAATADPGQVLFEQALLEETGRAAKKGKVRQQLGTS